MRIDSTTILFIILILFLLFSGPENDVISSEYEFNQLELLKSQFHQEYQSFQSMDPSTNFKNITGFKLSYQDILQNNSINATYPIPNKPYDDWQLSQRDLLLPQDIIDKITSDIWNASSSDIYPFNITSTLIGDLNVIANNYSMIPMPIAKFYDPSDDLSSTHPPTGEKLIQDWPTFGEVHNVTWQNGEVRIRIDPLNYQSPSPNAKEKVYFNSQSDKWKFLTVLITFSDHLEHERHIIDSKAIYDITNGRILLMTQSSKFHSIFAYPHIFFSNTKDHDHESFNQVKKLIDEFWSVSNYSQALTFGNFQDLYDNAITKCEYMGFFQLKPWSHYTKDQLKIIDDELQFPIGRPTNLSHLPLVSISNGLLFSPDCGIRMEMSNVQGKRYELQTRQRRNHLLIGALLYACEIYLLLLQMNNTNTPSNINKLSYYTFSMINLVDGSLGIVYFIMAGVLPDLYLLLLISAFLMFILASVFETRYLISIYASQINERNVNIITLMRGGSSFQMETTAPIVVDESQISNSLYGRFFFQLLIFTFLLIGSTTWPRRMRMGFEYITLFILNSYWIPQIFRNAVKGIPARNSTLNSTSPTRTPRRIMLWKFILGTSFIRLMPLFYVFTYSSNVFMHHKDIKFAIFISIWLLLQILVLYSQELFGSRWFLPIHVIPDGYQYHKSVSNELLLEHGTNKNHTVDCTICMSEVPVYIQDIEETHNIDKDTYMITPCNHIFHTTCLENWMSYKLQCPVCRAPLPPL
ncbi:hypothetical protein TBLA_0I01490 [Henningerozyma blattae CBS 6284]|uniref:RING-type E3 ubiquitin transferase n=1 Tax=Henningerozyma blattae (strain ATCC 34711 / CBS 6284 / DSM 70876 / NBRC 10599 / NRRL Y-10934 / UCD 77-7) TaxID=1071380 RepID=I2H8V6_HENB6|nr:hypothetical protein TBLA_0I01490 [Tetrapisispora blattae CBS 6284]CCH62808.1 hypothetical protein TBLA_0I01490 [Tetrapisispora blattae CBS 6284]